MNEESVQPHDYRPDYESLELDSRANWQQAQTNYRRLVHLWHPDKYAQRPRERRHAQSQFISLTKSYDSLKSFRRKNGRLPFEPVKAATEPRQAAAPNKRKKSGKFKANADSAAHIELAPGALSRDRNATDDAVLKPSIVGKLLWIGCAAAIMLGTVVMFYMLDRSANQKVMEAGREAIRDAPASEFMPSAAEIRRSESRGAFIQPPR